MCCQPFFVAALLTYTKKVCTGVNGTDCHLEAELQTAQDVGHVMYSSADEGHFSVCVLALALALPLRKALSTAVPPFLVRITICQNYRRNPPLLFHKV
jgi:hypothetical protein